MTKKKRVPSKARAVNPEEGRKPVKPAPVPPKRQDVTIAAAKGRPMLTWVGRRPLRRVTAFPAQLVETFNPVDQKGGWQNLLFHGDNKEVLAWLLANGFRGKVNLIYIDPPFDSGADYVRKVQLRGVAGTTKIDGETYTLGEQIQYTDIWANDNYLQFMYERLLLAKELLSEHGSIYLHCDPRRGAYLRLLMDEVFGEERLVNEIAWVRSLPHGNIAFGFGRNHDTLLFYSKGDSPIWNLQHTPHRKEYVDQFYRHVDEDGRVYRLISCINPNKSRRNLTYDWKGITRVWKFSRERMEEMDRKGLLVYSANGIPQYKGYLEGMEGVLVQDTWTDVSPVMGSALEKEEYPTQKPEGLLERILRASSKPDDLTLDFFLGSGTSAAVAQKLGRRWIGCDINKGAIQTTAKRVQTIIREQIEKGRQGNIPGSEPEGAAKLAALPFSVYRVNDYDLAVQHNEAVNLACEHLGVQRTRADAYFDGTLGKRLVKIVPFGHPLILLDLQELERELKSRPKEDRDVVLVCLGKEPAADSWLEEWNRHRPVSRIEVIELRTDKKYGKFFTHQPARARVDVKKAKGKIVVEVKDFISPTIIERLNMDQTLFKAQITDWRAMVDSVMIDTAYDDSVFNVAFSDVPERKTDLVAGRYELPAPDGPTTVAVKITDMLGEEVLEVRPIS